MYFQRIFNQLTFFLGLVIGLSLVACKQLPPPASQAAEDPLSPKFNPPTNSRNAPLFDQVRFERIISSDGLSHPYIFGISRDHLGFMWFATTNGLNLYDGYSFTIFRNQPGDRKTLDFDDLRLVYEDSDYNLWVGGAGGVDRFDRSIGEFSRLDEYGQVFCMLESQDGLLWVGFWHGLYAYDRHTGEMQHAFSSKVSGNIDPDSNLQGYIRAIAEDARGDLWLGTDYGLYRFDRTVDGFSRYAHDPHNPASLRHDRVHSVLVDLQGNIWVGTQEGLDRLDKDTVDFTHYSFHSLSQDSSNADLITALLEDAPGTLWVGTQDGLVYFEPSSNLSNRYRHIPDNPFSLSNNIVNSLFKDPTGLVWVGTRDGISIFNPRANQFEIIRYIDELTNVEPSLADNQTIPKDFSEMGLDAILEDQQGELWLGTMKAGLVRVNPGSGEIKTYRHDPDRPRSLRDDHVSAIFQDRSSTLWVGTGNGWLEKYDPQLDEFIPVEQLSAKIVSLGQDQSGDLWIGTITKGIVSYEIDKEFLIRYPYVDPAQFEGKNVFSSHIITSVFIDHAGLPWVGTYLGGINLWSDGKITYFRHNPENPNSLSHNYILSFYEETREGQDVMWVGTMGGGLNRLDLDSQTFTHYRVESGLADDIVTCILGDGMGELWMSTPKGLTRFDPESESFWNFNERDGVPGGSILPGGCLKRADDIMIFITPNSLILFDPAQVQVNQHIPPLVISSLMVNSQPLHKNLTSGLDIRLSYQENSLAFEFAALDYASPQENTFAYRMVGMEDGWLFAGTRHRVDYPDLNPGVYTFQVRGSNSDGVWNQQGVSVMITISPPFWRTGWFLGVVGLGLLAGVYYIYRMRVQRIEAQRSELEKQVNERTEEINQRRNEIEALYQADENLYQHLELNQVLQALIDTAVQLLAADKGSVMCWDDQRENLVIRAACNFQAHTVLNARIPRGQGIAGQVAQTGNTAIVEDAMQDANVTQAIVQPENIRAFVQVPIKIEQEVFGVFSADYTSPRSFKEDEVRLLLALAQRAAIAIQNAQLYEKAQELAAAQERSRLARELHDAVTQTLFSASLIAEALPMLWERSPEKGRDRLSKLRQLSRGALAEMRTLLVELRPSALMESRLEDLVQLLGESATGRTGIPVHIRIAELIPLPAEVHLSVYRIIQEALNNAVKHANASQIEVEIICSSQPGVEVEKLKLTVSDDGKGFDPDDTAAEQFGLKIMRERAQSIGAELTLESHPGTGTKICMEWRAAR